MAVNIPIPYELPEDALTHGMSGSLRLTKPMTAP